MAGWLKHVLGTKVLGVSLGGALGSAALGPLGAVVGSKFAGTSPLSDLRAGARNAAVIAPGIGLVTRGAGSADPSSDVEATGEYPSAGAPSSHGQGTLGKIGSFFSGQKNNLLDYGQAAEGVYDKYRSVQDYNRRKPLRDAGMAGLLDTSAPDTSTVFADPTAPSGRYRSISVGSRGRAI